MYQYPIQRDTWYGRIQWRYTYVEAAILWAVFWSLEQDISHFLESGAEPLHYMAALLPPLHLNGLFIFLFGPPHLSSFDIFLLTQQWLVLSLCCVMYKFSLCNLNYLLCYLCLALSYLFLRTFKLYLKYTLSIGVSVFLVDRGIVVSPYLHTILVILRVSWSCYEQSNPKDDLMEI
jgi:hypothetical protein